MSKQDRRAISFEALDTRGIWEAGENVEESEEMSLDALDYTVDMHPGAEPPEVRAVLARTSLQARQQRATTDSARQERALAASNAVPSQPFVQVAPVQAAAEAGVVRMQTKDLVLLSLALVLFGGLVFAGVLTLSA